jgi:aconitate hydratase
MGILPLQFKDGDTRETVGLTGTEIYSIEGVAGGLVPKQTVNVSAIRDDGSIAASFEAIARIDTPVEVQYYRHGGILQYVLRGLLGRR